MLKILADLLMAGEVTFEAGEIKVLHSRFILIPVDFFTALTKELSFNPKEVASFYELVKRIAKDNIMAEICKKYRVGGKKAIDLAKALADLGGYGHFDFVDYDEIHMRFIVVFKNSAIGSALKGQTTKPADHLIRGIAAGFFEAAYPGKKFDCIETKCIALGNPSCEFIVRLRDDLEKEKSQIISEQLSY